jgi:hypothetical protein
MAKIKTGLLIVSICLLLGSIAGCLAQTGRPSGTTRVEDGSVLELLDIKDAAIGSIQIVNMGNGQSVIIEDRSEISRILNRLARVLIQENLGDQGYTLTGYALTLVDQTQPQEVHIQLDVAQGDDFATFGGDYYIIDDRDTDELNDYFALAKYKYR